MKNKLMIAAGVLVLLAIIYIFAGGSKERAKFEEIKVQKGDVRSTILSTGTVAPENRLEIKPPIAGRAEKVLVEEGDSVKRGDILIWMSSTERAALLDAAMSRGPAELKRWEEFYKATPVYAPIDGTIILRNVEQGQTFTGSDAILVMSDRLSIQAQVDETDIAKVVPKQKAVVALDAYPTEFIDSFVEKVAYDSKIVNNVTTYIVDVIPERPPAYMKSGMTANVSFLVEEKDNVLLIPSVAITKKDGRSFVLISSNGKESKEIETGITDGKSVEIVSGLSDGERIYIEKKSNKEQKVNGTNPFSPFRQKKTGK